MTPAGYTPEDEAARVWEALAFLLHRVYEPLEVAGTNWVLLGSAASALQGVSVVPQSLRILTAREGLDIWTEHLWDWVDTPPQERRLGEVTTTLLVETVPVTVLVREPTAGQEEALVEGVAGALWGVVGRTRFQHWLVPVVPLEVQFATAVARLVRRPDQVAWQRLALGIGRMLRTEGFYRALLEEALKPYGASVAYVAWELLRTLRIPSLEQI